MCSNSPIEWVDFRPINTYYLNHLRNKSGWLAYKIKRSLTHWSSYAHRRVISRSFIEVLCRDPSVAIRRATRESVLSMFYVLMILD